MDLSKVLMLSMHCMSFSRYAASGLGYSCPTAQMKSANSRATAGQVCTLSLPLDSRVLYFPQSLTCAFQDISWTASLACFPRRSEYRVFRAGWR